MEEKLTGTVIFFKGHWGFIKQPNDERDIFVHWSDISHEGYKTLKKGQTVTYSIGTNNSGQPKAIDVVVVTDA